jgi:hypothetical protein
MSIVSERRDKTLVKELPYPYPTSEAQFKRSVKTAWNARVVF